MLLATWNVNSINVRLPQVLEWLNQLKPNVLCLQETKVTDDKFPSQEFKELGYQSQFSGEKTYNGVAILSDRPLTNIVKGLADIPDPQPKRFITGTYGNVQIMNVYVPNGSEVGSDKYKYKLAWIQSLRQFLQLNHTPDELLVLTGDFNVAPEDRDVYDPVALSGEILVSDLERKAILQVKDWGFIDVFRKFHNDNKLFSWWDYRMNAFSRNHGLRIDHIWATNALANKTCSIYIDKEPRKLTRPSDHAPVICKFDI